ncbi:MAG: lysylphosphatidylglycerol synthase transmembrane domain-containing protein [Candidatus Limnocylindrales bacterium]
MTDAEPPIPPDQPAAPDAAPASAEDDTRGSVSLGARLRQPRTILSIVVPLGIIGFFLYLNRDRLVQVPELILKANPALVLLAAFGIFYVGFPLRGFRWAMLLRSTGQPITFKDSTEILYLSWLVNCLVPAKLGDVYRAYLLKINSTASLSRTFGTVFIERILDLFVIAILGLVAGFWSFRNGLPPEIQFVGALGVAVVVVLAGLLLTLRNFGRQIITRLPLPHRALELYERFEEGVFGAITLRQLPPLLVVTVLIWATEGIRLWLVVQALGFPDVQLGISGAVFVALIGSLLTAVPLSPAGLGVVDAGMGAVLVLAYGLPVTEATTIVVVDRVISVFSIILFGSILYVISGKRKGEGLTPVTGEAVPA